MSNTAPPRHRDAVHAVGDLVTVWFSNRESPGVVTAVDVHNDEVIYEVHTIPGGPGAWVGHENMRAEIKPDVGQQWVSTSGRTLTVGAFDTQDTPTGLIAIDQANPRRRIVLTAPHWALIVSGPHPATTTVRHCDIGGERLDESWWLLQAMGRHWENDHGAACPRHAGQTPSPAATSLL